MSDEQVPPNPPEAGGPPPPPSDPPAAAPPPPPATPPPPAAGGGSTENPNRIAFLWLSYAWILALFPFLMEKEDREVQWHAKHGLVITGAEVLLNIVLMVIVNQVACLGCVIQPIAWLAFLVFRIMAAVKATKGERMTIPGLSELADKF